MKKLVVILLTILMLFSLFQGALGENVVKADNGYSWIPMNKGLADMIFRGNSISTLIVYPKNTQTLYAAASNGVYRSMDGGASWTQAGLKDKTVRSLAVNPKDSKIIYAEVQDAGLFKSTDSGRTWTQINTGLTNIQITSIAIDNVNSNVIYVGTRGGGIFKSTDSGNSWKAVNNGLTNLYFHSLVINPKDTNIIYAAGESLFKSVNGGASWSASNNGLPKYSTIGALAIDPQNTNIIYAGGALNFIFKSLDGGSTWNKVNVSTEFVNKGVYSLIIDPQNTDVIYAVTDQGYLYKTIDSGSSWDCVKITYAINNELTDFYVRSLVVDPNNTSIIYAGGKGVFKYTNQQYNPKIVVVLHIGKTKFTVNDVSNTLDSPPIIKNGRTLVPIRAVIEALGGVAEWNATAKKVTINLGSNIVILWIGNNIARVNDISVPIDPSNMKVVPEIISSRTMLPLRFVTENLGCDVQWDGATQTITITYVST